MGIIGEIRQDIEKNALILISEYRNRLFRDALKLCRNNVSDAEDLVANTMVSAFKSLEGYEEQGDMYAWLKTILVRRHADQARKPVAAGTVPVDPTVLEGDESLAANATEEAILRNSDSEALRAALERLDPKYKQTVLLHYLAEMPVKDIAAVMKVPAGTVLWRLNIARKILARDLGAKLGKKGKLVLLAILFLSVSAFAAWVAGAFDGEEISIEEEDQQEVEMNGVKSIGVAAFAAAVTLAQPASGSVRWVDQANGNDSWNGLAEFWDGTNGPKASFTNLTSFAADDTIYVKPGHYRISAEIDPRKSGISFIGIGKREEIILDGEGRTPIFQCWDLNEYWFSGMTFVNAYTTTGSGNGANGSAIRSYSSTDVTVSNCVFRNCVNVNYSGGAVSLMGQRGTIVDCVFSNCEATARSGGAVNLEGRGAQILRCRFEDCRAGEKGGAVNYNGRSSYAAPWTVIEDCQFVSNTAVTAFGAYAGGGIFKRCDFIGNSANYGGALGVRYGDVNDNASTVYCLDCEDCTFVGNWARASQSGRGAGVAYLYGGDAPIMSNAFTRCSFVDNVASNGSGGVIWGGVWKIADCAFSHNLAKAGSGGALVLGAYTPGKVWSCERSVFVGNVATNEALSASGGAISGAKNGTIRNCLFDGNKSSNTGGAMVLSSTRVENCTLVRNASRGNGGAIINGDALVAVTNCLFMGNTSKNGNYRDFGNDNLGNLSGFCCLTDGYYWHKDANIQADDPLFVDYDNGNLRLKRWSACVNAGTNLMWMVGAKDLDGRKGRIAQSVVDIGCYEYWPLPSGLILLMK